MCPLCPSGSYVHGIETTELHVNQMVKQSGETTKTVILVDLKGRDSLAARELARK